MKNLIDSVKEWLRPPRKTILVIDDSVLDRTFVQRVLSRRYHVQTATNGQSGIEAARQKRPDLILLDYMMPDMKGPDVCRALKSDQATEAIPVIFLTSMDDALSMSDGFEEGADQYLTKPIGKSALLGQVKLRLQPPVFH